MGVFDTSTPTGSEGISSGDDRIREFKSATQEALRGGAAEGEEAIFPGSAPLTAPVYRYRGLKGSSAARPTSGQYGLYFDTTRNVLQRDNGTTWDDLATNFPAGTIMLFAQASAPVGWTKLTTQNDKALRIVSGSTGGSAGGTLGLSGGIPHTHTIASHVHDIPEASIEHHHSTTIIQSDANSLSAVGAINGQGDDVPNGTAVHTFAGTSTTASSGWQYQRTSAVEGFADGNTGGTALTTDETTPVLAYVDVIQASKD